jgi:DNA-binding MarR family transcriptional regulator
MNPRTGPEVARAAEIAVALDELIRLYRRLSPPSDLSLIAVATLSNVDRNGPARLTELAAAEAVSQPAMTQLVTRLQQAGLAERVADSADGRVVQVHITAAGRVELARRRKVRTDRLAGLLDALTARERSALTAALPAITALTQLAAKPAAGLTTDGKHR